MSMLNWFSKYRSPFAAKPASATKTATATKPGQAAAEATAAAAAIKAQRKADARAQQAEHDQAAWAPRWQAALGDDAALLKVALDCPVLGLRQSAVEALVSEDALRQAEIAFRNKDRRVHQLAKRRFEAAVLRRESLARGQALLVSAQALAGQGLVPVNHLVALDRDWAALDPALLDAPLIERFTQVRHSLDGLAQAQAELQQRTQRRQQAARQGLAALQAAGQALLGDETADAPDFSALGAARDALQALLDDAVEPALDLALARSLQTTLLDAQALQSRLQWLMAAQAAQAAAAAAAVASAAAVADAAAADVALVPAGPASAATGDVRVAESVTDGAADAVSVEIVATDPALTAPEPAAAPPVDVDAEAAHAAALAVAAAIRVDADPAVHLAEADPAADPAAAVPAVHPAGAAPAVHPAQAAPALVAAEALATIAAPAPAWSDLPAIGQAGWAAVLDQRFASLQRQQRPAPASPVARPPRRAAAPAPVWSAPQLEALDKRLQQAEAALAEGHLGPLQQQLQAFDQALTRGPALPPGDSLVQRAAALQAEHQRLKSWQQWGGGRARDDLAAEAEVLARATAAAADPALADAPKLDLKAHAEAINALRARWRELDRLGAAASQALWLRFDAALKDAYQPLAERQAAQKAQRQQNQRERETLLAALEAWPGTVTSAPVAASQSPATARLSPADADAAAPAEAAGAEAEAETKTEIEAKAKAKTATETETETETASPPASAKPVDEPADEPGETGAWKDRIRALDRFHNAWRQLGPLEHSVPAGAREALRQRQQRALERLEAPLQQARRDAAGRRELLITQAEALAARAAQPAQANRPNQEPEGGRRPGPSDFSRRPGADDVAQQVRNLQADWQQQARELPLARGVEAALWGRFRAAVDAVFAQRQAVWHARDAEAAGQQAEREAWITRLTALPADGPAAEARRVLAEVEQAWRQPMDLPRGAAATLDGQFRDARAAVQQRLAASVGRQWQAWCDALLAGLQQARQREQAGADPAAAPAALADGMADVMADLPPDLPAAWARALAERLAAPAAPGPLAAGAFDAVMLPLEAALDMPATAEQQTARRLLKLQALKQTLEGRAAPAAVTASPADALVAALRQAVLPEAQQQRVLAVVAALRRAGPGALGVPPPRA